MLSIGYPHYYLLTLIDYFSGYIVAWEIAKNETRVDAENQLALAYLSKRIKPGHPKPVFRADLG